MSGLDASSNLESVARQKLISELLLVVYDLSNLEISCQQPRRAMSVPRRCSQNRKICSDLGTIVPASADILPSGHARQMLMGESAWHDAARRGTTRHVSTGQCHNTASDSTARPTRSRDDDGVVRRPCGVVSRREAGRAVYSCMYTLVGWRWDAAGATVGIRAAAARQRVASPRAPVW